MEGVQDVRRGCVAACATRPAGAFTDSLLIVAEGKGAKGGRGGGKTEQLAACADAIADIIAREAGLAVHVVALIPERALVKTGSGKVARQLVRKEWEGGKLPILYERRAEAGGEEVSFRALAEEGSAPQAST